MISDPDAVEDGIKSFVFGTGNGLTVDVEEDVRMRETSDFEEFLFKFDASRNSWLPLLLDDVDSRLEILMFTKF